MATFIALTVLILAVVYFIWLLKICDKDNDQKEKIKDKTVNGISTFIAIAITIAVVIFIIYLIWVVWFYFCLGGMVFMSDSIGDAIMFLIISILAFLYLLGFFIRK